MVPKYFKLQLGMNAISPEVAKAILRIIGTMPEECALKELDMNVSVCLEKKGNIWGPTL